MSFKTEEDYRELGRELANDWVHSALKDATREQANRQIRVIYYMGLYFLGFYIFNMVKQTGASLKDLVSDAGSAIVAEVAHFQAEADLYVEFDK